MKKIILSFDYELFFGDQSGTVKKSLIEPTNALMDQMEAVGFRGNFFIDWLMIKYMKLEKDDRCKADLKLVEGQIKDMVRRGHRVELHIHPHWVDAKYNGDGTWNFKDFTHYSLNSLTEEEVVEMFVKGVRCLEEIVHEVDSHYRIIAYRAGGWAVQPFESNKKGFIAAGLHVDSSVAHGCYLEKDNSYFDFRNSPDKCWYRFMDDVCKESTEPQSLVEVPISTYRRDTLTSLLSFISNKLTKKYIRLTDGTHQRKGDPTNTKLNAVERRKRACMFGLDVMPFRTELKVLMTKKTLLCFLSHPKDFNGYTLSNIKMLARHCQSTSYFELYNSL